MTPRRLFNLLRERLLTAVIVLTLLAVVPFSIPGLRSELLAALSAETGTVAVHGDFDPNAEDSIAEDPNAEAPEPPVPGERPGIFKRIITSPVRLMSRLFRGKERKEEAVVSRPTAKDIETFRPVPVTRTRDGMGSEVAREELHPTETQATAAPVPSPTATPAEVTAAVLERNSAALFDQAVELHQKGLYNNAVEKLNAALAMNSRFADAHNLLGVCYDQQRLYVQAQAEYQKAIKSDKGNPRFYNNLGYSYYLAGDDRNAIKWLKKALKFTPDDPRLHNNLGLAYGRKGERDKAMEHFTRSVGEAGAHLNLGYVLNQQGRYDDAIREYEMALRLQPQSLTALSSLVQLYERTGRLREAAYASDMHKRLSSSAQQKSNQ